MKRIAKVAITIMIAFSLLASVAAFAAGDIVYLTTQKLANNLEYVNAVAWDMRFGRTESHSVVLSGAGDAYPIIMNGKTIYGATKISEMVEYAESIGKNLLAAVNADFFSMSTGVPLGVVIEDGEYKSSTSGWNSICFGYDGGAFFVEGSTVEMLLYNNGILKDDIEDEESDIEENNETDNSGKTVNLFTFNKMRVDTGGLYMFSEAFSTVSTRTSTPGWFVVFKILEGRPSVSGTMELEVVSLLESDGSIPIEQGHMILSAAWASGYGAEYEKFAIGDKVTLTTECSDERLIEAQYATSGGDIIVSDGIMTDSSEWDSGLLLKAPRTAFGVRNDGSIVSYVIDGRNNEHSTGLTMNELAEEMIRQGCIYAVNFDGGGSSALSVRLPGEEAASVINRISEGSERGCATYLLYVTDAEPDGEASNLSLRNNGIVVLAGSEAELLLSATDNGYMPASVPNDVIATTSLSGASISANKYIAGEAAGVDRVELHSPSTGAFGYGEIFVITRPTSITISARGGTAPVTFVQMAPGSVLELNVQASYYRRSVIAQNESFLYEIDGDIGDITDDGVFTAGAMSGISGVITVSAGGMTSTVEVEILGFEDMEDHWAKEYASYLLQTGISNGISDTEYGPDLLMRRGDYILMLYRAAGEPVVSVFSAFDDVPPDMYYTQALTWAKREGIAEALDGNNIYPQLPLTRQDAFVFTYRALGLLGKQYIEGTFEDLTQFPDAELLDEHAIVPTATLVMLGVVEGADGFLMPSETLTRAQMAKILAVVLKL